MYWEINLLKKNLLPALLLSIASLCAQESIPTGTEPPQVVVEESPEDSPLKLEEMAIIKDIETSSLAELNVWAKSLGLPTSKNADSVKRTLASHFKVELTKTSPSKGKVITINRAELSNYYTTEIVDESVAEFEGGVDIVIDDPEKKMQHYIKANKVNYNRTQNSITAYGNVKYKKIEKGKNPLTVNADSLTFNVESWNGALLKCISQQDKTINEEEMVFYYVAGEIKLSSTSVMGMGDVTVQTVLGSPYFNISALDLWMLDSSDFIIVMPFIRIGHVPVFWAPVYYHSDNNLYFNPVFGIKSREGTTLQNTIYLMGTKAKNEDESQFSFLSFENGEASNNKELNSLTLVPSGDKTTYSSDYSKFMVDYYSNLGIFLGNKTAMEFSEEKVEFTLETGLGFSRNISDTDGSVFTNRESNWNTSYFMETELPFRYMFYLDMETPIADIDLNILSDRFFRTDFLDRQEDFQWIDYFTDQLNDGLENLSDSSDTVGEWERDTTVEDEIPSYFLGIDFAKYSPKFKILNPYISSFILDFKEIKLEFDSKHDTNYTTVLKYDPSYYFFYPDQLTLPVTLTASGTLLNKKISGDKSADSTEEDVYTFSDPLFEIPNPTFEDDTKTAEGEDIDLLDGLKSFEIVDNNLFDDEKVSSINKSDILTAKLKYSIKTPFNLYGYWDNSTWQTREDIDYSLKESEMLINVDPSFTSSFSMGFLDDFIELDNSITGKMYIKKYLEEDEQSDLLSVYKWNKTSLTDDFTFTLNLLQPFRAIERHSISLKYELDTQLYERTFDNDEYTANGSDSPYYEEVFFDWSKDTIDKQEVTAEYIYDLDFSETTFTYIMGLPPLEMERDISLSQKFDIDILDNLNTTSKTTFGYEYNIDEGDEDDPTDDTSEEIYRFKEVYTMDLMDLSASANWYFEYSESFIDPVDGEDEWDFDSVDMKMSYEVNDFIDVGATSAYSVEDEKWESFGATLDIWDFEFELESRYDIPVKWNNNTYIWEEVSSDDDDKELAIDALNITHNYKLKDLYLWKNRIKMNITSNLSVNKEFVEVDDSALKYKLIFNLDIYEFLTLSFSSTSVNNAMYQYFGSDLNTLGLSGRKNIFKDLFNSFNFFSYEARKESNFNLKTIDIDATYKMPDWNLIFSYSGEPLLENEEIKWYQVFSFFIQWKPLSIVTSKVVNDDSRWSVSTSSTEEE